MDCIFSWTMRKHGDGNWQTQARTWPCIRAMFATFEGGKSGWYGFKTKGGTARIQGSQYRKGKKVTPVPSSCWLFTGSPTHLVFTRWSVNLTRSCITGEGGRIRSPWGGSRIYHVFFWFEQNHWKSVLLKTWVILVFPTSTAVLLRQQDNKKECAHCTNLRIHIQKYRKILLYLLKNFTHPTPEAENSAFEYFIIWNESDKRLFEMGAIKDYLKSVRLKIIWNRCD